MAYGARFYNPTLGIFHGVDAWVEKYPSWSPYVYTLNNPIRYTDPTGNGPTDFVILIAKDGAGGKGHMASVIQDGKGNYYYATMGLQVVMSHKCY
ncbi:MAG: hypothetical protein IPJ13_28040 [Saprospiraceae bacterium]|nr:hypothetical protein [Saprospiraceae bacterium]